MRRWSLAVLIGSLCFGSVAATFGQQIPSVMKQPTARPPQQAQRQIPPAALGRQPTPAPVPKTNTTSNPNNFNPNNSPVAGDLATEQQPIPTNPGQILLKEASAKASTAKDDGDFSEVIAIASEGMKEKPGQAGEEYGRKLLSWAHNRRGQAFAEHGLHDQAIEDFTAALSYDPQLWRAIHNRGVSLASKGDKQAALADFNRSLELNKGFANTWANRGELHAELGKHDLAARDFNEALRLNPQDGPSYLGRGKALARLGKVRESLQDFDNAARAEPKNAAVRLQRAEAYSSVKAWATAAEEYKTVIALKPDSGAAYRGLAWIMATCPDAQLRNAEQAVATAQKAMELDGNNDPRVVETLAAAFANSGQFDAAAELLKHSLTNVNQTVAGRWQAQIAIYQQGKPWRDGPEARTTANPTTANRPTPNPAPANRNPQPKR